MTSFTAPPNQTGLILNAFDTLNVFSGGIATGTIINENSVENVNPGGKALFTILNQGGVLNVGDTGIGTTINGAGNENVFGTGTVTDTTINTGGSELLNAGTTAIDTIINAGGAQSGSGTAIGTIINEGGVQSVSGTAKGTIINGGLESISSGGIADGVDFIGAHSTLALATPSGLTGVVRNWHAGDVIDFLNTQVTGVNETGNTLTVTYGDHQTASYSLAGQQANTQFALKSDGQGGTELFLQTTNLAVPGQPFSPETAGTIVYTAEFGSAPSATELTILNQFTQAQFDFGQKIGVMDPSIYAFQALGVALASTATNFQNTFGPAVDGDVQFVVDAYAGVFGHPGSGAQIQQFADQLNSFEALYTTAGTFGSASNIDLLARGAIYGQMLGIEHESAPVGIEPGGTTFTAPPNQNNLMLNSGDILNVNDHGQANSTAVDSGGVINVNLGGQAFDTRLVGGVVNVNAGGTARQTFILDGVENVIGLSDSPTIEGGVENVVAGGRVEGSIIFTGGGVLKLFDPTQWFNGSIIDEAAGNGGVVIDFVNTNVTSFTPSGTPQSFQLVLTYGNNQTITYQGVIPGNGNSFPSVDLAPDGHGGTNLIISGFAPIAEAQSSVDVIGIQHQLEHPAV